MNPLIKFAAKQANNNSVGLSMLQRFQEFRKGWTDESAQAKINEMLQSGQITQQQVEQAKMAAKQLRGLLK